jgi:hypothetical protein
LVRSLVRSHAFGKENDRERPVTRIRKTVDRLRERAQAALAELRAAGPVFKRIVNGILDNITNERHKRECAEILLKQDQFLAKARAYGDEVEAALAEVHLAFGELEQEMLPLLQSLQPGRNPDPSVESKLHLELLGKQLEGMTLRRDVALALIEAPLHAAIICMNDATQILIGARHRFSLDLGELAKDVVEMGTDLVPGATGITIVLRQFRNRIKESADRLIASISDSDRLYDFRDYAEASLALLEDWRGKADLVLQDLNSIANTEFRAFVDGLRVNMEA